MASQEVRAARAFLFRRGIKNIAPAKFAAAAKEMKTDFGELLYLLGLLYDGPGVASSIQREKAIDAEQLKLTEMGT